MELDQKNTIIYQRMAKPISNSPTTESQLNLCMSIVYSWLILGLLTFLATAEVFWQHPVWETFLQQRHLDTALLLLSFLLIICYRTQFSLLTKLPTYILTSILIGIQLNPIFYYYDTSTIISALIGTSFAFICLSIFGISTQKNLTKLGTFCFIGLTGLIGISILGFIFPILLSNSIVYAKAAAAIIIFSGLIAHDTQKGKQLISEKLSRGNNFSEILVGTLDVALDFLLDFINLFLDILTFAKKK